MFRDPHTINVSSSYLDQGLRKYMLRIYNYMFLGLGLTALMAFLGATTPALQQLLFNVSYTGAVSPSGFCWLLFFAQIGIVFYLSARIHTLDPSKAQTLFWVYSVLMGLSLSSIFLVYTSASIFRVFLVTSATFGGMSLYGYTTKRDLSAFGSFLFMGLLGIIIASVVNMFAQSSMMEFVISCLGVLIFTGLTAYDTQRLKSLFYEGDDQATVQRKAILGALTLYLDFINLFLMLLRFLGDRR